MNKIVISFLLTSFAGLSTLIGYFMIFIKGDKEKIITFSLSFSASVMITLSIIDLIPSSLNYLNNYMIYFRLLIVIFFFILGICLSYFISHKIENNNSLKKIGIISLLTIILHNILEGIITFIISGVNISFGIKLAIAIGLHNIPEGIITFIISGVNISFGIKLAIAIGLHNIPEGISIAIPIYYGTNNKLKTFIIVLIAGLSEILGAMLCYLFLSNIINNFFIGIIFAIISGMMINISISELLPVAFIYKKKSIIILGLIIGFIMIIVSHLL